MGTTAAAMGTTVAAMGTAAAAIRESMNPTCIPDTCRTLSPHVRLERHGACVQDLRNVSAVLQHGPSCSTACMKPLLLGLAPPGERFSSPPPRSPRAPALFRAELPNEGAGVTLIPALCAAAVLLATPAAQSAAQSARPCCRRSSCTLPGAARKRLIEPPPLGTIWQHPKAAH